MPRPRLKGFRHSREIIAYAVWGYCGSGWPRVGAIGVLWVWGALGSLPRHVGHRGVRRAPGLRSFRETSALQTYIPSTGTPVSAYPPQGSSQGEISLWGLWNICAIPVPTYFQGGWNIISPLLPDS